MDLESERIRLRYFIMDDVPQVYAYCSLPEVGIRAGWARHESMQETEKLVEKWQNKRNVWAICHKSSGGTVIGHIGVYENQEEGRADMKELGFCLHPQYWQQGIMTEAIKLILNELRARHIHSVWACCFRDNEASKALIEKCGFTYIRSGFYYSESLDRTFQSCEYRMELQPF